MRAIITQIGTESFEINIYGCGIDALYAVKSISIDNGIKSFAIKNIPHSRENCEKLPELKML